MAKNTRGLILHDDHYAILRELGISITHVKYTTETEDIIATQSGGMHQGLLVDRVTFEVSGEITDSLDLDKLHEIMLLLREAKLSNNPAVMDLYDQLRTVLGLTK